MSAGPPIRYTAGELRERMPTITAWLDDMRSAFGAETINAAIKAGIGGAPRFFASENGIEVGTKRPDPPALDVSNVDSVLRLLTVDRPCER